MEVVIIIPLEIKSTCVKMKELGLSVKEIYNTYFSKQFINPPTYDSFRNSIKNWIRKEYPDQFTLDAGTYEGFIAHDATVQVSKNGEIVQAWIKQKADSMDLDSFIKGIKAVTEPYVYTKTLDNSSSRMLEIPLFDMHWGIAYLDYYRPILDEILGIINSNKWDKIVIPFGQDFFHNDSIVNPITTKGTVIEKVDMERAVKDGKIFMFSIIEAAINSSNDVSVFYSPGNHDQSISWMFSQVLLERYGSDIVDDSIQYRKGILYGTNAIMFTHGNSKRANAKNLAHMFPISFPEEFSKAVIREVHAGHLHEEKDADVFGVMVRRLSTGGKKDEWSDKEDFIGSNKRFMLFDWSLDKLKAIYYI